MPSALASFFFLAEDGIRDRNVTGVQTCALPISSAMADIWVPLRAGSDIIFLGGMINYVLANNKEFREYVVNYTNARSEERRVGKEIISWRSPVHYKQDWFGTASLVFLLGIFIAL